MDCGIHDGKMTGKVRSRTPLPARGYSKRLLRPGERGRRHLLLKSTSGSAQQEDSEEMEEERRESTLSGGTRQSKIVLRYKEYDKRKSEINPNPSI